MRPNLARSQDGTPPRPDIAREVAFEALYRDYFPRLVNTCRSWGLDGAAEDVAQETLVRAFVCKDELDPSGTWPWLRKVAFNLMTDRARRERRQVPTEPSALPDSPESPPNVEERHAVSQALSRLPERQRLAMALRYLGDLDRGEAATLLGVNVTAFDRLLFRARQGFKAVYSRAADGAWGLVSVPLHWLRRQGRDLAAWARRTGIRSGHEEQLASFTAQHLATGILALVIAFGSPSTPSQGGPRPPQPDDVGPEARASSRERIAPPPPAEREAHPELDGQSGGTGPWKPVDDLTRPNDGVAEPEDASITSISPSPRFSEDGTVYAAGVTRCRGVLCPSVLFRSTDGGARWRRLRARDFYGASLLLPPAYGTIDHRIFAMGPTGLQVSEDGGRTFVPAAVGGAHQTVGSAAISPAFNDGDPTILIGAQTLMRYRDDLRTVEAVPSTAVPGPLEPAYSPRYPVDGRLLIGGVQFDPRWGHAGATMFTCTDAVCSRVAVSRHEESPKIRPDPDFPESGRVYAFTSRRLFSSEDDGESFSQVRTPWNEEVVLRDIAVGASGRRLFAAVQGVESSARSDAGLYVSDDGGRSWRRAESSLFVAGAALVAVEGEKILAGLGKTGLACSQDGGRTWARRCR